MTMSHIANDMYIENIKDQMIDLKLRMQDVEGEEYNNLFDQYMVLEQEKRLWVKEDREWIKKFTKTTPRKIYVVRELSPKDEFIEQERINYDQKHYSPSCYN